MIIRIIIILLLFTIIIAYINKKVEIHQGIEFTQKDIINKFNSSGLLITLNTTDLYCSEYVENLKKCINDKCFNNCPLGQSDLNCECINISQCTIKDVSDIANILNINKKVASTSCFAIDTTYLHKSIPPILFGPYPSMSFPIGIILDYDIIKSYIGCAYSFDAGTVARIPDESIADGCLQSALNITDEKILNGELYKGTIDKITNDNCPPSSMIGCLNPNRISYSPQLGEFDITKSPNVQKCDDIQNEYCLSKSAFWDLDSNPFYEGNESGMNLFKKDVIKTQDILGKQIRNTFDYNNINAYTNSDYAPDYWGYNVIGKNGYRENEVDLFVPQKNGTDINKVCNPTDKFKEIWKEAIIGIFTNNICSINSRYNKIPSGNNCCLSGFNEDLVKKLVETFNKNNNKKINGYVINTIPQDRRVESTTGIYNLDIKQIT